MKKINIIIIVSLILSFVLSFTVSAKDYKDSLTITPEEAENLGLSEEQIENFGTKESLQFKLYMAEMDDLMHGFSQGGTINEKLNRIEELVISSAEIYTKDNKTYCGSKFKNNSGGFDYVMLTRWKGIYQYMFDNEELSKLVKKDINILEVYCFEVKIPYPELFSCESFIYYVTDSGDYVMYVSGEIHDDPRIYYYIRWFTAEKFSEIAKEISDDMDVAGYHSLNRELSAFLLNNDRELYNNSIVYTNIKPELTPTPAPNPTPTPIETVVQTPELTPTPEETAEPPITENEPQNNAVWIVVITIASAIILGGVALVIIKNNRKK